MRLMPAMRQLDSLSIVIPPHALNESVVRRVLVSDFMHAMLSREQLSRKARKGARIVVISFGSALLWLCWAHTCATCVK